MPTILNAAQFAALALVTRDHRLAGSPAVPSGEIGVPLRWPFRRIAGAAVLTFTAADRHLQFDAIHSVSHRDEKHLVTALFDFMRSLTDHRLLVWHGHALRQLRLAGLDYRLLLPSTLGSASAGNSTAPVDVSLVCEMPQEPIADLCQRLEWPMPLNEPIASGDFDCDEQRHAVEAAESRAVAIAMAMTGGFHGAALIDDATGAYHNLLCGVAEQRPDAGYLPSIIATRDRLCLELAERARAFARSERGSGLAWQAN